MDADKLKCEIAECAARSRLEEALRAKREATMNGDAEERQDNAEKVRRGSDSDAELTGSSASLPAIPDMPDMGDMTAIVSVKSLQRAFGLLAVNGIEFEYMEEWARAVGLSIRMRDVGM